MTKRGGGLSFCELVALAAAAVLLAAQAKLAVAGGYYNPAIEDVVREEVQKGIKTYPGVGPGLIRLLFHDCWVKVIDAIKAKLTAHGVTCTDAIIYAAREATIHLSRGKIKYYVAGPGRKDGLVSSAEHANEFLPLPTASFPDLVEIFKTKGFDATELVVLSGAHAVGVANYTSFKHRLRLPAVGKINTLYQLQLGVQTAKDGVTTPNPNESNNVRDMDNVRKLSFYDDQGVNVADKGVLDNSYYTANLQNMVLFNSDWVLTQDKAARDAMELYKKDADTWYDLFGKAMGKLSELPMDEGAGWEIRKNCRTTNDASWY
ncbi:hypothetical protein BRADI_2g37080v3 [Brachypodium distachyon]|uniref:Peroxidase n=2 Tax=Brachypodium distachyon TaxID=15368 RepID=A0A2K2DCA4_BRADI|nr:hypothetical protein BRADI_2g37080v3 [Brachypodium distachyon]